MLCCWARIAPSPLPGDGLSHPEHRGPGRIPTGDRNDSGGTPPSGHGSSVTLDPYCAPALGNRTRLGGFTPFHNPTGGVRRHLPLHKGGFSLLHCIQPTFVLLLSAGAVPCRDGHIFFAWMDTTGPFCVTGLGLHPGPCRGWPASPGARLQTTHTAFSEFWERRLAA